MPKIIYLITDSKGNIPQKKHETESLDLKVLKNELEKRKYVVKIYSYLEVINFLNKQDINNNYFMYASSQYNSVKSLIDDCLLYIVNMGGIIIPNYSLALAHENKALQELEKKRLNIRTPRSYVISSQEEAELILEEIEYPFIAKVSKGFASRGVEKITKKKDGKRFIRKYMKLYDGDNIKEKLIHLYRKFKFKNKYPNRIGKVIFQEKIRTLDSDWKVLVFYDKYYILKRYTKQNDFRASGSGIFDISADVPENIIYFANEVTQKLNSPLLSLDIVEKDGVCYLIEYQAVHFGLLTAIDNNVYYQLTSKGIIKNKKSNDVEYDFAYAIDNYISLES